MRPKAPFLLLLCLTGCGGFGDILGDSTELPGSLPNMPKMESENVRRSMGHAVAEPPILSQGQDIWANQIQSMPTLADISSGRVHAESGHFVRRSANGTQQLLDGGSLSIGDDGDLPTDMPAVQDGHHGTGHSAINRAEAANSAIIVPHADGSKTVIQADGAVVEQPHP
ncbi:hypothetical protein K6L44_14875 [Gluconacetobacter entanii]|uniref:hypothetical protein n=1 Tax=Gluconacetobacter entanii TaxID=108528 RepID=UPI001C93463D|nr:hypothetical protein [Gluconacetobacter entanii]MBY4641246.1 hypothetical protein [Gluconacetobacter entanii]MCW4581957.1 hypothetical protein [Gluconacetobacter entanii]MCW4585301.1 hypothetical protein [Gluconacetobacter entanii]MCW4588878.1 hypothetical protein [Gluconacetobacter entanii]